MALQFPTCSVLAIDLSRTSLAYATRKAGDLNIRNIAFAQADLLELSAVALGAPQMTFGIISCSGVLHHLASPLDGWRRLVALLASNGVMKIGLYAKYARRDVDAARAFAREGGYAATAEGIRACRQAILALPPSHTARGVTRFLDFFAISGCRDLILHPQERTYTAPELAHALETLGLRFLGFQVDATVAARFRQQFPHADAWVDLACWDRYEEQHPDTFAGMYQFWCTRDGAVDSASVLR
jgi:SAM-dependent methyltransferase